MLLKVFACPTEVGGLAIDNPDFARTFRARFGRNEGDSLPIKVRRDTMTLTLPGKIRLGERVETRLEAHAGASPKAARIRNGILRGVVDAP